MNSSATKPLIIAICGYKRCGKDSLATHISNTYGYKQVKISSKLKNTIKVAFNLNDDDLETNKKDEINHYWGVKPRVLMDFIGTHVFQYEIEKILPNMNRRFWIRSIIEDLNEPIVISDLRFKHELEEIIKYPSLIIRINRECANNDENYLSEKEINELKSDIYIDNDSGLSDMFTKFDEYFSNQKK